MRPLVTLKNVSLSYGHVPLLDQVQFKIEPGERVCLVGRNGAGKSTLMRVIQGEAPPDDGEIWRRDGLQIAHLTQDVQAKEQRIVFDVVAAGLSKIGELLSDYHHVVRQLEREDSAELVAHLAALQHQLETENGWRFEQRVATVISRLDLPEDMPMAHLSGGVKRRVLLAQALVSEPDLLLLDEPTNHLDIAGITWLEEFMLGFKGALIFITHDRTFLQRLATRIIELDRGQLTSWLGDYRHYLQKKEQRLAVELDQNAKFDKKLAQEEAWIRQGIKARRTRNEGRVRALQALREQRRLRREQAGKANLQLEQGDLSGKLVAEIEKASLHFGGTCIFKDFSTRILRGDRIGIIGPNGVGKSSLIKVLLGELQSDSGTVRLGTKLQTAYFEQQRAILDPEKTVMDNLNQGKETVTIKGRERHVIGYLKGFLFPPQQIHSPVKTLSGGERNRLLLARLFTRPANMLVLDEPTNDLDVETLELLETLLADFDGTLIVVSHDRAFLDNVVTSTLVFEGDGKIGEYIGGYADWSEYFSKYVASHRVAGNRSKPDGQAPNGKTAPPAKPTRQERRRKLGYKEQRELEMLPERIEHLETEQAGLQSRVSQADFYQQEQRLIADTLKQLDSITAELEQAYQRWAELEE